MQSALSFAPLRPVGFVNFHGAGRGGARPAFCRAGQPIFPRGWGGAGLDDHPCFIKYVQLHHESNSVFRQDKEMLSLHKVYN